MAAAAERLPVSSLTSRCLPRASWRAEANCVARQADEELLPSERRRKMSTSRRCRSLRSSRRPARVGAALLRRRLPTKEELEAVSAAIASWSPVTTATEEVEDPVVRMQEQFETVRATFLRQNGGIITNADLGVLSPAPVRDDQKQRFLKTLEVFGMHTLTLGYHGTPERNLASIFKTGLRVPKSRFEVANGSSHGRGIYLAHAGSEGLSKGFLRGSHKMLICGVADTTNVPLDPSGDAVAQPAAQLASIPKFTRRGGVLAHREHRQPPRTARQLMSKRVAKNGTQYMRGRCVSAENPHIRHVGAAMVVFRSSHVVPLFVADAAPGSSTREQAEEMQESCSPIDLSAPMNGTYDPERVGRRQLYDLDREAIVWLPTSGEADEHSTAVRRRFARRRREAERRACRGEKHSAIWAHQ